MIVGKATAPIVGYMRTWSEAQIRRYCAKKGWGVTNAMGKS